MPDNKPAHDTPTTLGYAGQRDVRRHPGPSDESVIRFFGWGLWIAIAIPFLGGGIWIALLLLTD